MAGWRTEAVRLLHRGRRLLLVLGALIVLYGLIGFLWVPRLAQGAAQRYAQDIGARVSMGALRFNPFRLSAEIEQFRLTGNDGALLLGFTRLRINAELLTSLWHRAWTLRELSLEAPELHVVVNADGSLNLARLVPRSTSPAPTSSAASTLPAVRVGRLGVSAGVVALEDRSRAQPFVATLRRIEFRLNDFRTQLSFQNAYRFAATTLAGEQLAWSGRFSVQPLGSDGEFSVGALRAATIAAYLQDVLPVALPAGFVDLQGRYRLAYTDRLALNVELPTLRLREFAVAPKQPVESTPWITLPLLEVSNAALSLAERSISIGALQVQGARVTAWRDADGQFNLSRLMSAPVPAADATAGAAGAWQIGIDTIGVSGTAVTFEDRTTTPAAKFELTPVEMTIRGYRSRPGQPLDWQLQLGTGGTGRLTAQGQLQLDPLAADARFELTDFDLPPLQPYVAQSTAMELIGGRLAARGQWHLADRPVARASKLQFTGEISVANLRTRDSARHQDFINWQRLRVTGIDFRQQPDRLDIDSVMATKPYGKVVIAANQSLNVTEVLRPAGAAAATGATPAAPPAAGATGRASAVAPVTDAAAPMPMRIRRVSIEDGTADFADYSVQPSFAVGIVGLNGTVTGLSSASDSRAEVQLRGSVDRYAPVDISGSVNLLSAALYSDLALNFRNMDLTTFNPYSGKFAGYSIAKGKLTTELRYRIDQRKLDAQHHIIIDQLEFGAATESKDAVPLPIKLAVALLKDRNGVIDINLPVSGSMDDPSFRIGPIVWKAVVGLLRRIVTAPFALLGALFGGGDELAFIDFAAGSTQLTAEQQDKLDKLGKALVERPQLRLDVPLQTLGAGDEAALAAASFEQQLAEKLPATPAGDAVAQSRARLAALVALATAADGAAPTWPPELPAPPVKAPASEKNLSAEVVAARLAWLEPQMRARQVATPEQRATLMRSRAETVRTALLTNTAVDPARVFLVERASAAAAPAGAVRMELKLE